MRSENIKFYILVKMYIIFHHYFPVFHDFVYINKKKIFRLKSSAGSVCCFLEQETFTPQKVLVIPRNRWLRLNMTEKLFTGTLNNNKKKTDFV